MLHTELRSFHAVAEAGGFTAASKVLNVGQPVITRQVRDLEQRYTVNLFDRIGRTVRMTAQGAALHAITKRLFAVEAEAIEYLSNAGDLKIGKLKIGTVDMSGIFPIVSTYSASYPDIIIELEQGKSEMVREWLLDLKIDIAFGSIQMDTDGVIQDLYRTHEVILVVPRSHAWATRSEISIRELNNSNLLLPEADSYIRRVFEAAMRSHQVPFRIAMEVGGGSAIIDAVAHSLGIAVAWDALPLDRERLAPVRIKDADLTVPVYMSYLESRKDWLSIKAFISQVQKPEVINGRDPAAAQC